MSFEKMELPNWELQFDKRSGNFEKRHKDYTTKQNTGWRHVKMHKSNFPWYKYHYLIRMRNKQVYRMGSNQPINWIK